ncbi:MAG: hypothetical protein Q7S51_10640, partial [Gallionellaceae bacterium]|nr:hypothetical protein [Gallionellaceae bacterium]
QQVGAIHTLSHTLSQEQQDKQPTHVPACGECAAYTQLGSVLHSTAPVILLISTLAVTLSTTATVFRSIQLSAAVARGPPVQKIA